ncbi:putative acetylglutamate kinase [Rosa chinensis]|uniref:Putative acetylglutamate kinase n=1 Tax=Rosa chinensis TaxID=74649 RepID=A0A2P6PHL9_ROSCH|nr:acetylglutamate kinase, chloroplastic [Rosa chinensis]PRQ21409.1 putative acetylglutamate kinase [Rosa chinensis]
MLASKTHPCPSLISFPPSPTPHNLPNTLTFFCPKCPPHSHSLSIKAQHPAHTTPGQLRVDILSESLPFIQKFRGKTIVVKYGGAAMKDETLQATVVRDLFLLACVGLRPILVHGSGPEINLWLKRLNIEVNFHDGLRVTDAPTMEIISMFLAGKVNKHLVSLINREGVKAIDLCGSDGELITARPAPNAPKLGFVGEVARMDLSILRSIVDDGHIPVIASEW